MKRRLILALILVAFLAGGIFFHLKGKRFEVAITQEQIDAGLSDRFPVTKRKLLIFRITYSNPQVTLLETENRVQVGLDATLNIRINDEPRELGGSVTVTSGIRYDQETREFYLENAEFDRLEIAGIPDRWLDLVTGFASEMAREYLETKPIYKLEAKDAGTLAAKLMLKGFEVRGQAIHVTLGL